MDVNYFFRRQQVERSLAEAADSAAAKNAHEELARAYERQLERKSGGRIVFPWSRRRSASASRSRSGSS
jgi:hypothetical protein